MNSVNYISLIQGVHSIIKSEKLQIGLKRKSEISTKLKAKNKNLYQMLLN